MANDIKSSEECLKAIDILMGELKNAKRSLISSDSCLVNRSLMQAQLEYLRNHLPDTVKKAAAIVQEEETIRIETEQKKKEILENASIQAQNMVNEATQNSQQMMEQANKDAVSLVEHANQEASARVEAAAAEASRMLEDAENKARQMVEEESIVRRARVECEELRESARQEATELHKNTLDYMDSLLAETDRKLSELLNNIRLERNEIRNHR
jgi:cell division septum initiation protein DivIVA